MQISFMDMTVVAENLVTAPTKLVWLKAVSGFESRL